MSEPNLEELKIELGKAVDFLADAPEICKVWIGVHGLGGAIEALAEKAIDSYERYHGLLKTELRYPLYEWLCDELENILNKAEAKDAKDE